MKRIFDIIKEIRYRRLLKRSFEPRAEFLETSRMAFLDAVAKRRVAPLTSYTAWHTFGMRGLRYGAAFASIAIMSTSGLVAYADYRNVPVESPLYSLKRVGEQIRLVTTPTIRESEIYQELAHRRADEFVTMESKRILATSNSDELSQKEQKKENKLRKDFRKNVEKIEEYSATTGSAEYVPVVEYKTDLCRAAEVVEKYSGNGKSDAYKKFEKRCKELLSTEEDNNSTTTILNDNEEDDREQDARKESRVRRVEKPELN